MSLNEIQRLIPHRPPMLLLDRIVSREEGRIVCEKTFRGDEFFFQGHYPNFPIVPGVILCEASMQAGAILLSHVASEYQGVPVATRLNDVKLKRMIRPQDIIQIEVTLAERMADAFFLAAKVTCEGKVAARLAFACTMAEQPAEPSEAGNANCESRTQDTDGTDVLDMSPSRESNSLDSGYSTRDSSSSSDFLQLGGKTILVFGVANRKSVAFHVAKILEDVGANVIYVVRSEQRKEQVGKLRPNRPIYICDVEDDGQITRLRDDLSQHHDRIDGMLHSIAFADYEKGGKPFHETTKRQFLRTVDVSCFSLISLANALKEQFHADASVVTVSISTTRMASENYGFMAPVKAALDSSLAFLAKSFSQFSRVRFNAVAPGLLKTSASAGIPGYVDAYLFAEQVIPRKTAIRTEEAANMAAFLLSPRSSGINAQSVVVDAGMSINYFDRDVVKRAVQSE